MNTILIIVIILIGITLSDFLSRKLKVREKPRRLLIIFLVPLIVLPLIMSLLNVEATYGCKSHISEKKLEVQFIRADRNWSTSMVLGESKKLNISSTCESGILTLTVSQGEATQSFDISNFHGDLEFPDFSAGKYIRVQFTHKDAKNASVVVEPLE